MPIRVPVVLSRDEVKKVMAQLTGTMWIIVMLLLGITSTRRLFRKR